MYQALWGAAALVTVAVAAAECIKLTWAAGAILGSTGKLGAW